ncbi:Fe-S cluster assembly transcription factor [Moritella marina ATCC 15381]|uniref:Fe-S cluster assembly transcription factor n=1 Tax=Moritella marina ATCC 15381 TaxID=1202962 RepID=A0A5J6WL85_MORMI|nr:MULTISPECIES: Fe-S cluster assembly transcription factor [Moritella]QFI38916.1 Fe-S cluster assembly transcription factor [Moritella marina ATCC 15381]GIC76429.1 HTH-type transcriptional regulator IscR [Moritella sp. F1]GIC80902.1 HTH-type transcriptional regulator IscR [Moritella sp. F3]
MRLTSKGRYAVTAMIDLALHAEIKPVPLAEISERQSISLSYLEQLFSRLRRKNLVASARGPGGGYKLGMLPGLISVGMIIDAVDENVKATKCDSSGGCNDGKRCLTHSLWDDLSERISDFLDNISLADLMANNEIKQIVNEQDNDRQMLNKIDVNII